MRTDPEENPLQQVQDAELNALLDEFVPLEAPSNQASEQVSQASAPERLHGAEIARRARGARLDGSPTERTEEWWFEVDSRRVGPLRVEQARELWEEGRITPDSLCWRAGFSAWIALFRISELVEAFAPRQLGAAAAPAPRVVPFDGVWKPIAGEALLSSNRERLSQTQPVVEAPPLPEPSAPAPIAHAFVPSSGEWFRAALVGGFVSGTMVACALLIARMLWPLPGEAPRMSAPQPAPMEDAARSPGPPAPAEQQPVLDVKAPAPAAAPTATPLQKPAPTSELPPRAAKLAPPVASAPEAHAVEPAPAAHAHAAPAVAPRSAAASPKPAAPADEDDDGFAQTFAPRDELMLSDVFEVVAAHRSEVDACVTTHQADSDGSGRLVIRWTVTPQGTTSNVKVKTAAMSSSPLAGCLVGAISGWTFPQRADGREIVEVPFTY